MIVNFRRIFQVGFKVNKSHGKELVIVDYFKQCYPKIIEEDVKEVMKQIYPFYFPEALKKAIEDYL